LREKHQKSEISRETANNAAWFAYIWRAENRPYQAKISIMWVRAANSAFGDLSTDAKWGARIVKVAADREVTNL